MEVIENGKRIEISDDERTPCEVWTRVMGYYRPTSFFNNGKLAEFSERKYFKIAEGEDQNV